jgi:DNA-binding beta-propeller fold protein YncE
MPHPINAVTVLPISLMRSALIFSLFALLLITGCATTSDIEKTASREVQSVWPGPPEQPRVRFVDSIKTRSDVEGEKTPTLRDRLLGAKQEKKLLLNKPYAVHSDSRGRVYVSDSGTAGVVVFNQSNNSVSYLGQSGPGTLRNARGITTDEQGNIYVSDIADNRVVVFDQQGMFVKALGGQNVLQGPVGLAYHEQRQLLYVVDVKKHQIVAFNNDGEVEFTIGEKGNGEGQFSFPTNIALDASQEQLFIADTLNFRVQILKPDGSFVRAFGQNGNAPGTFSRLKGIGVDNEGHIYTVDAAFNNFQIFDQQGQLLLAVGRASLANDGFYLPAGAFVDKNNRIYIADQLNRRIQIFEYLGEAEGHSNSN